MGVYLTGVAIGLILLATFKMMSWRQHQQRAQQAQDAAGSTVPPAAAPAGGAAKQP